MDITSVTRYVRDAGGNVIAVYEDTVASEYHIYGISRLGVYKGGKVQRTAKPRREAVRVE